MFNKAQNDTKAKPGGVVRYLLAHLSVNHADVKEETVCRSNNGELVAAGKLGLRIPITVRTESG